MVVVVHVNDGKKEHAILNLSFTCVCGGGGKGGGRSLYLRPLRPLLLGRRCRLLCRK